MSSEQILLVMTAVLAVVALAAAFIAVRAARRLRTTPMAQAEASSTDIAVRTPSVPVTVAREEQEARIVEGRVIVPPTSRQVVETTLGKPLVRVSVISHGLAHALRPESRDRILGMMRRELRSRRRQRKRAARQAARLANPTPPRPVDRTRGQAIATNEAWLGELPAPRQPAQARGEADS